MKAAALPELRATRLLDQVRERIRYKHYSLRTEQAYVYWVRLFIRWHQLRHPRDMGRTQIEAFLAMLANERQVAAATHNQALSALLFLYREVLNVALPWLDDVERPKTPKRIPSVFTTTEVASLLTMLEPDMALIARLLYGTGMRLMEGLRLRVKDLDFDRGVIIVREAKATRTASSCSRKRWRWPLSTSRCRYTRCATRSPLTCCSREPTYERYRNCWDTAISVPP